MRLTNKLCAQHIGWHFKKHWLVQGKRVPRETGAAAELLRLGVQVKSPEEIVEPKPKRAVINIVGSALRSIPEDHSHPNWHTNPCHLFGDNNVLLGGLSQAQVLTNTIEIQSFPQHIDDAIQNQQLPSALDRNVRHAILSSHVLDAEQVKLPKVKLVDRPAYNLPRTYGISHERRNRLLLNKLLFELEKLAGRSVAVRRKLIDNAGVKASISKDGDLLGFETKADKLICSTRALSTIKGKFDEDLPDLYPMKCTISIPKCHIYTEENFYPFRSDVNCSHPHTLFAYFNKNLIRNSHGSEVTETQFQARTLVKAFALAVARAKQLQGNNAAGALARPIVVQSIQTDGRVFHFGIFQLNTLDLNASSATKNYWFHRPSIELFTESGYQAGRPHLEGYNADAIRILNAFYNNS